MEHLPTLIHDTVDIMEFNHQNYINHSPTIPRVQWVIVENSHIALEIRQEFPTRLMRIDVRKFP